MLGRPIGKLVASEMLEIAASGVRHYPGVTPEVAVWRSWLTLIRSKPLDRRTEVFTHQLDHRVHIDTTCHVADEIDQGRHARECKQDGYAEEVCGMNSPSPWARTLRNTVSA